MSGMTGETKTGRIATGIAAAVITVGAAIGGVGAYNAVRSSNEARAVYVASDHQFSQAMNQSAADDQQVQEDAVQTQHINDVNAQVQAAEDAKAAAAAALAAQQAAQAQAAADAAAQAQQQASANSSSSGPSRQASTSGGSQAASSGAASGTPLPMTTVTDPNNAQYGQSVPAVDPSSFCASGTASTIGGVPTCD